MMTFKGREDHDDHDSDATLLLMLKRNKCGGNLEVDASTLKEKLS